MKEKFSVDYMLSDDIKKTYAVGDEVFTVKVEYEQQTEYCNVCKQWHNTGQLKKYNVTSQVIIGFEIDGNHAFAYSTKNSFILKIKTIDEEENSRTFNVGKIFYKIEEAKEYGERGINF